MQAQLAAAFDVMLEDNRAWTCQPDGAWKRLSRARTRRAREPRRAHAQGAHARPAPRRPAPALSPAPRQPIPNLENHPQMKVGIVDVGSNTVRLLVARREGGALASLEGGARASLPGRGRRARRQAQRGADRPGRELRGSLRGHRARLGARAVEVIVTAPGAPELEREPPRAELSAATGVPVRVLSADEEGRLAFAGAVAASWSLPERRGLRRGRRLDEVVVGTVEGGPAWSRSLDIGAVRLTQRFLGGDPPGRRALRLRGTRWSATWRGFAPPLPQAALATGGTARALRKLVGRELDAEELDAALRIILGKHPAAKVARAFGLHERPGPHRRCRGRHRLVPAGPPQGCLLEVSRRPARGRRARARPRAGGPRVAK